MSEAHAEASETDQRKKKDTSKQICEGKKRKTNNKIRKCRRNPHAKNNLKPFSFKSYISSEKTGTNIQNFGSPDAPSCYQR